MIATTKSRPLLRYHGGKWILAPWIIGHFPEHRVYVEPFGGGASVLLRKPRAYAEVYNDLDTEIVNLFAVARDRGDELVNTLELTPFARDEYRESFIESADPIEQARRTLIRSHMGFGSNALNRAIKSGFRNNSTRSGTLPAHDWAKLPNTLTNTISRLRGVVVENKPACALIEQMDGPDTLFYCDPPYVPETRSTLMHGNHGYAHEMTVEQHEELAALLNRVQGMVILSGYPSSLYERLYAGWRRVERPALADGARHRTEVLWMRNVPESGRLL